MTLLHTVALHTVAEWFSLIFIALGSAFAILGGVGMLRFPDFYSRCHASGVTDSAGAGFLLAGLALAAGWDIDAFKLIATLFFLWLTSVSSTHALAKAAFAKGVRAHGAHVGVSAEDEGMANSGIPEANGR